jgi:hypothetical protein
MRHQYIGIAIMVALLAAAPIALYPVFMTEQHFGYDGADCQRPGKSCSDPIYS